MFPLKAIQDAIGAEGLDGWLLYDFRDNNPLACRVLGLGPEAHLTRRLFCFVPAEGEPLKLVHRIEDSVLAAVPGKTMLYSSADEMRGALTEMLNGVGRAAMEYAPDGTNPYISLVDAGTVELVRSIGAEVASSGNLVQRFDAVWSGAQWAAHREASAGVLAAFDAAWAMVRECLAAGESLRETEVQAVMLDRLAGAGLVTDHPPIVAVGPNSGNAHYAPQAGSDAEIVKDAFLLIDAWGKLDHPDAVYADYTRVAYTGDAVTPMIAEVFGVVAAARDAAVSLVEKAFSDGATLEGWEVDRAARGVIEAAGYADAFVHRTGHSIGRELHGSGAHMDSLETRDERTVMPGTCFSIEPGIYLPEFGVRSEVNLYVDPQGKVHVTGEPQSEVLLLHT